MKNCPNCGQVNHDTQMSCGRCGAFLNAPQQSGFNQPNFNQPNFNQPMPSAPAKKSSLGKILAIAGGSLVVLALLGGGLIFLLVTQTTQYKIASKWRVDGATMNGVSAPIKQLEGTTLKFNWDQTFVTTLPNGTTESGKYKVINEQTISTTDRNNQTLNYTVSFDGNKMTLVSTKNNINISIMYSKTS